MLKFKIYQDLIEIAKITYQKGLVTASSGNISIRLDKNTILITTSGSSFGFLKKEDLVKVNLEGKVIAAKKGKRPSSELSLHLAIHKNLNPKIVFHTHPKFTNAFFTTQEKLNPLTYETKLFVGSVPVIEQNSPNVLDIAPIIEVLKTNSLVVLRNHGVVTIGDSLLDNLFLTEILEEAVQMQTIAKLFVKSENKSIKNNIEEKIVQTKKYKLFSKEQIETVVDLVNRNEDIQKQGQALDLTMCLAIKLDQTESVFNMHFEKGKVNKVTNDENADFLISGPDYIWKAIFNRTLDPFVATTQKKLKLKGDFARLSRWYPVFVRIFEIWGQVPVE